MPERHSASVHVDPRPVPTEFPSVGESLGGSVSTSAGDSAVGLALPDGRREQIRIRTEDGTNRTYRAGEVFHLQHEEPHAEWYGPEGVRYLVARRSRAG